MRARHDIGQVRAMGKGWTWVTAGIALFALACDADPGLDAGSADATVLDAAMLDASADAGPTSTVALPATPDPGACPEGWRAVERDGFSLCDPWPETGIAECAAPGEAHFPGGPGCERVGTACGADGFADDLPATGVVFVRAGAVGGDGSRASPFGRIADALAVATSGSTIALSTGEFTQDQIDLPDGVTLHGSCTAETVLRSDLDGIETFLGVVTVYGAGGVIKNLRIEGARPGISVNGGSVEVREVVVARAVGQGVLVLNGGVLTGGRLVVRDTQPWMGSIEGVGLQVSTRSTVTLAEAVFARNVVQGVSASGMETLVRITDAAVYDTRTAVGTNTLGTGFSGANGARLELTRVAVDRVSYAGIRALNGAEVVIDRAVVRDVAQSANITAFGAGVAAEAGVLRGSRVWVERASHTGAIAFESGALLALTDAVVRETRVADRPMPDVFGLGVWADDAAEVVLERVAVADNTFVGVLVQQGSRATLTDVIVRGTRGRPIDGTYGRGVEVIDASVTLTRGLLEQNHDASLTAFRVGTTLDATDLTIRGTLPIADGRFGYAAQVADGATVTFTGADFEGSHGHGVFAIGVGTTVRMTRARVADVRPFAGDSFAYGLASVDGALVTLSSFVVERAGDAALQLAGGEADLSDGVIGDTPIGFNVQTPGFDEARLRTGVSFRAVGVEVDRSALTVGVEIPPFGI